MNKKTAGILLTALVTSLSLTAIPAHAATTFTDLKTTNPHYQAIQWLTQNGVIQGYGDGTFRPENPVNRAEMLKMIFIADGKKNEAESSFNDQYLFPDTPKTAWYASFVSLAKKRNTVQGYPDGNFKPANNINKAEAYKIILKEYYNEDTMNFAVTRGNLPDNTATNPGSVPLDVKKSDWYFSFINFAALKNLYDAGEWNSRKNAPAFNAGQSMTRGEVAELIYRAKAVSDNFPNNIEADSSMFSSKIIPFTTNLYQYKFLESSGTANFTVADEAYTNSFYVYSTKYPQSLLTSNGDTTNTIKFYSGSKANELEITLVVKENPNQLSIQDFYNKEGVNLYKTSVTHDDLLVNTLPAVWFHRVGETPTSTKEVVVVGFKNAIVEITDLNGRHQTDGVFNYLVRNFWFKNLAF